MNRPALISYLNKWLPILLFFLFSGPLSAQVNPVFVWPVDTPVRLAGTFGELRAGHFHSGLDFRTGGEEGKPVCAAAAGWVSRVKISTGGFGIAVYVDHPEGFTTVYAHLHHLTGELAWFVDSAQQAARSYETELFPDSGRFSVQSGELIALSGNTGASEGPHLHFEIRKRSEQIPVNPMAYLPLPDTIAPAIDELLVYHVKGRRHILYRQQYLQAQRPTSEITLPVRMFPDTIAFAAKMNDSDPPSKLGIYSASLQVDENPVFSISFDSLNFDDGRYANAHSVSPRAGTRFHRLHRLPGNMAGSFRTQGSGLILLTDTLPHRCRISTRDFAGNTDTAAFTVRAVTDTLALLDAAGESAPDTICYLYDSSNTFFAGSSNARLEVPAGAAYQDFILTFTKVDGLKSGLSAVYELNMKEDVPFHKAAAMIIPLLTDSVRWLDRSKLVVVRRDFEGKWRETLLPDFVEGDSLRVKVRYPGRYTVVTDTVAPSIASWTRKTDAVDGKVIEVVTIEEERSGFAGAEVSSGAQWIMSYWDPRSKTLQWKDPAGLLFPAAYVLKLKDAVRNLLVYHLYR